MTRKDYVALAEAIRENVAYYSEYPKSPEYLAAKSITVSVADRLAADNGRFDRERFMTAAGF